MLSDSVTITLSKQNHKTHFIETEQYLSTNVYSKDRKVNTIDEMTDWYVAGLHTSSIWARDIPYDGCLHECITKLYFNFGSNHYQSFNVIIKKLADSFNWFNFQKQY